MVKRDVGLILAVDFDGTVVTHEYPRVGRNIGATPVLKALVENGHKLILFTMRDEFPRKGIDGSVRNCLQEALDWFKAEGIELWGINENPKQSWSASRKVYAHTYIDDAALGIPLVEGHVHWPAVLDLLHKRNFITDEQKAAIEKDPKWMEETGLWKPE